jgi:hypothetical protein
MNEEDWTNQRIELLLRHVQELRDFSAQVMQIRRALTEKHRTERTNFETVEGHKTIDRAELLIKQSEELVVLASRNTRDRMNLMDRQQRELEEFNKQVAEWQDENDEGEKKQWD